MTLDDDRVDQLLTEQTPGSDMDPDYDVAASTSAYDEEPGEEAYEQPGDESYDDPLDEVFDDDGNLMPASEL